MRLSIANLRRDGTTAGIRWDLLLGIVADITIEVDGRIWYTETMFPVVEFAVQLFRWMRPHPENRSDFSYTSLESAQEGLIRFHRGDLGWALSAPDEEFELERNVETGELDGACRDYLQDLKAKLQETLGLDLQSILNEEMRRG